MIEKDQIAEAVRYADAEVEEHGFDAYMRRRGIDPHDLIYVADQRALRSCMVLDGHDPNFVHRTEIRLSEHAKSLMPVMTALWMDAFNAGLSVGKVAGDA